MIRWLHAIRSALSRIRFWEKWFFPPIDDPLPPTPPPGPKPAIIADDPSQVPIGPNLVRNGSFELGDFGAGTEKIVAPGSPAITDWSVAGKQLRWIDSSHPIFNQAAEGAKFVDLRGGLAPQSGSAVLYETYALGLQPGQRYEFGISLGLGPDNGPQANFGGSMGVLIRITVSATELEHAFTHTPNPIAGVGVVWEQFRFRFAIPAGYYVSPTAQEIRIFAGGNAFFAVDNVSLRLLG